MDVSRLMPRTGGQALDALRWTSQSSALGRQPGVLVVDDEPDVRLLVTLMLRQQYAVHEAAQADEAIKALAQGQRQSVQGNEIRVVLLDVMMPGMDGLTLCRRIKREFDVPVVLFSARASPADREAAMESGADDYLVKPFSYRALVDKVARYSGVERV